MGMLLYGSLIRVSVLSEYDYPGACGRQEKQEGITTNAKKLRCVKTVCEAGGKKFRRKQKTSSQVCAKGGALLVLWGPQLSQDAQLTPLP